MKAIKLMMTGGLLILLGPIMALMDVTFTGLMILLPFIGIPLFIWGLLTPANGSKPPKQLDDLPQKECPACGKKHDFDYPQCPYCGHDYQAKQTK